MNSKAVYEQAEHRSFRAAWLHLFFRWFCSPDIQAAQKSKRVLSISKQFDRRPAADGILTCKETCMIHLNVSKNIMTINTPTMDIEGTNKHLFWRQ